MCVCVGMIHTCIYTCMHTHTSTGVIEMCLFSFRRDECPCIDTCMCALMCVCVCICMCVSILCMFGCVICVIISVYSGVGTVD